MILDSQEIDLAYVEQLQEENKNLTIANERMKQALEVLAADFKTTKDSVMKIIGMIGLLDAEGNLKESIDYKQMLGTVTRIMWMTDAKRAEEFGFLVSMVPIILKYKDI